MPPVAPLTPRAATPGPPRELEGDTYIHVHHPANSPSAGSDRDREGFKEASPQTPFHGDAFSGSVMGAGGEEDGVEHETIESPVRGRVP